MLDYITAYGTITAAEGEWTPDVVHARFVEAFETMIRLPSARPQGYKSCMPAPLREYKDEFARAVEQGGWHTLTDAEQKALYRRMPPSREQVTRMEECVDWLRWVPKEQAIVIVGRALHRPSREIRMRLKAQGFHDDNGKPPSRWSVNRWQAKGLEKICRRLNDR